MPVPKPRKNENRAAFMKRCMEKMTDERPQKQSVAICIGQWGATPLRKVGKK